MNKYPLHKKLLLCIALTAGLSACNTTTNITKTHDLKHTEHYTKDTYKGYYKVGKPYKIYGIKYTPKEEPDYNEVGMASWYGPKFHGKETASGDQFNQYALTAAHKTLPLPSKVRVTNTENGRSLVLMVNDRGPFSKGRIIDVSRRAADLLGFEKKGLAKVRVQYLDGQSRRLLRDLALKSDETPSTTAMAMVEAVPTAEITSAELAALTDDTEIDIQTLTIDKSPKPLANNDSQLFLQVGAYGKRENAHKLQSDLARFKKAHVVPVHVNDDTIYRVWMGPFANQNEVTTLAKRVKNSGHDDVIVVSR